MGDRFQAGECELQVTQPRFPCFKLGIRFGDPTMIRHFLQRNQPGVYFSVIKEGSVQAGDSLTLLKKSDSQLTITDIVRLYAIDKDDRAGIELAANDLHLPEDWREYFAKKLE
ncbi:MOSC domain-containing protein [Tunicatimonas pelagia]|uniref:MOSC domain-containing protein n=1 Tax=Tunicatimonas pelagia TaxID=931531 RepID=UPI0026651091|nr:MOSC domain-containing protein [Tunicatimonas pelagia]WKN46401.1 MOSC domain-containing protein [Tunicatimonas pelagia]